MPHDVGEYSAESIFQAVSAQLHWTFSKGRAFEVWIAKWRRQLASWLGASTLASLGYRMQHATRDDLGEQKLATAVAVLNDESKTITIEDPVGGGGRAQTLCASNATIALDMSLCVHLKGSASLLLEAMTCWAAAKLDEDVGAIEAWAMKL